MDDGLKQRLIGAFVLLALAVIFIPVLFDRERMEPVDTRTQIPAAPHIEPVVIETPVPTATVEVVDAVPLMEKTELEKAGEKATKNSAAKKKVRKKETVMEQTYVPDDSVEESREPEPIGVDENGVTKGWVLQVASFKAAEHATAFRDTLIKADYSAYTRTVNTSKGEMTRVYVGPKIEKSILLKQQKDIEKKFKVDTLLLKFKP